MVRAFFLPNIQSPLREEEQEREMSRQEYLKNVSSFPVGIKGIVVIVCALITASAVMAYAAGYSIADFVTPAEADSSSGAGSSRISAIHFGNGKVVDLSRLGGTYGGAYFINRPDHAAGYFFSGENSARRAADVSDAVVKNPGAPAGTFGDVGHTAFLNTDSMRDLNSLVSPTSGGYSAQTQGRNNVISVDDNKKVNTPIYYYNLPWPIVTPIIIPIPGPGPASTPIPAALPLFGSGLALLWLLHRRRGKSG